MAVRYDKKFNEEINRVIKSYNRKISRLNKLGGHILPQRFTNSNLKDLKLTSRTRAEVRKKLRDLSTFTARGAEKMITINSTTIPRYQNELIKKYRRLATYRLNKKIKEYETTHPVSNGKRDKRTFAELGEDDYLTLLAKKEKLIDNADISKMTPKEIEDYIHKLKANTRDYDLDLWQQNYINIFQDTALSYGYDPDKLDTIVYALQNLSPEQFDKLAFENRNIRAVLTHYKSLLDIKSASDMEKNSEAVIDNLDSIYTHLDEIFSYLKNE